MALVASLLYILQSFLLIILVVGSARSSKKIVVVIFMIVKHKNKTFLYESELGWLVLYSHSIFTFFPNLFVYRKITVFLETISLPFFPCVRWVLEDFLVWQGIPHPLTTSCYLFPSFVILWNPQNDVVCDPVATQSIL